MYFIIYIIIICITLFLLLLFSEMQAWQCPNGFCQLENSECNIPSDSECDQSASQRFCNGHGKCYNDQFKTRRTCICFDEWTDTNCEHEYPLTNSESCNNDLDCNSGWCVSGNNKTAVCACPEGFSGHHCEKLKRSFLNETWLCHGGGKAYVQGRRLGCSCPCGLVGQFCEERHPYTSQLKACSSLCYPGQCKTSTVGTALTTTNYGCECPNGYSGIYCEHYTYDKPDVPVVRPRTSPCPNISNYPLCKHNGTCFVDNISSLTQYVCNCSCGFHGTYCEFSIQPSDTNYKDPCTTAPFSCKNGGTCYYSTADCKTKCKCVDRFAGEDCWKQCEGPHVGCANYNCGKLFDCVEDECGDPRCEKNENYEKTEGLTLSKLAAIVSSSILGFVMLVIIVCCIRRHMLKLPSSFTIPTTCHVQQASPIQHSVPRENTNISSIIIISNNGISINENNNNNNVPITVGSYTSPPPTYDEAVRDPPTYFEVLRLMILERSGTTGSCNISP